MSDDDFEIRPGRIRDRSSGQGKARTLKAQLRALSNRAGHGGRSGGSGSRRGTGRLARGRIASLRATSRASQRRVIVKARIVRHRGSRFTAAPLAQHLTYLKRDGVTRDGKDAELFGADPEPVNGKLFAERCGASLMLVRKDATRLASVDAIAIELCVRELKHEIDAYEEFCDYRQGESDRRGVDPAGQLGFGNGNA